jgi:hypothetical protein
MEDNVCAIQRQAGDLFITNLIDRNSAPLGLILLFAAKLIHKPLQVGG